MARQSAITVTAPVRIKGVAIRPSATQIAILKEIVLKAELLYSDGRTKDVTQNVTFTNLTPRLGFLAGSRFVAGQTEGLARVEVRYTEQGKEFTAIANITIKQTLQ